MRPYELILKKRNGEALHPDEVRFLVDGFTAGSIPDYQMAAFLMAVYFRGMTEEETVALTVAMAESGEQLDLSAIPGVKVDKHSTGGVGDKTSLILVPLASAAGLPVAKLSGRALGHTGGTLDKLESIPGFQVELSAEAFLDQVKRVGAVIAGQTGNLTPADKKLYALRDVTATVDSIPLIAASVMSKKIAAGADAFVLDVKTGSGAFMRERDDAVELARRMVAIARGAGRRAVAYVTGMDEPLGRAVGNALEVVEAIETLMGEGPRDLTELCLTLAGEMLHLGGVAQTPEEGKEAARRALGEGRAYERFVEMVKAQGGDAAALEEGGRGLARAEVRMPVPAPDGGWVAAIDALEVGLATMALGAGRTVKDAAIDHGVGIVIERKVGDRVEVGESLAEVFARDEGSAAAAIERVQKAYRLSQEPVAPPPLIFARIAE